MAYLNLKEFIHVLKQAGELVVVDEPVSTVFEIPEIIDRLSKHNGPAVLFTNNGTDFPLLINALGSEKRMKLALGLEDLDDVGREINSLIARFQQNKESLFDKLKLLPELLKISRWMPREMTGGGACQQVVMAQPDLSKLPVLTCWPQDGGPFITFPVVHTVDPETGVRNVGMYRMQVFGKDLTGMHWHLHKGSAAHYRIYQERGERMPVSVVLGGDPVYTYVATAPLPEGIDEYQYAGFLRKKRVELVKCRTNDLYVPADADFVLEGYVDPAEELIWEGPFGDHTGFYSLADYYPRFHVTCITHRKDAVYPSTIVGTPPQEDGWIGKATERLFLPLMKLSLVPEIEDMDMPVEGVFHNLVIVKISQTYPGQAVKVMNALWGAGQMMFNKIMLVVSGPVDIHDYNALARHLLDRVNPQTDIHFSSGPLDVLDHASSRFAVGSKIGIDATGEEVKPSHTTGLPVDDVKVRQLFEEVVHVDKRFSELLQTVVIYVVKTSQYHVEMLHRALVEGGCVSSSVLVIYLDVKYHPETTLGDVIWLTGNNIEPLRDVSVVNGVVGIDATKKTEAIDGFSRGWPDIITSKMETILQVDHKWASMGLGAFLESPSRKYSCL